jgi:hypothetical protein
LYGYPCGIWFFSPIADIRDKIPRFDKNFWDQNRKIPQLIIGKWYAQGPYDVPEMS